MIETTFLPRIPLFSGLNQTELDMVRARLVEHEYGRGDVIFRQGDPGHLVHFLREGRVKISRIEADGREHIVRFFDPGKGFGLVVALDLQPYPSTATAVYPSRVWSMRIADYRHLQQEIAGLNPVGIICANLREAQDRAQSLAVQSLHVRLVKYLLAEAEQRGRRQGDHVVLPLNLTREELAGLMGAARESVSRALAELRRSGAIQDDPVGNLLLNEEKLYDWLEEGR